MSYLIINIYDSAYEFSVCKNGKVIPKYEHDGSWDYNKEVLPYYKIYNDNLNYEEEFAKLDFDLIILCENGETKVLKNLSDCHELGSIKDLLNDLKGDINHINSFEEFVENKKFLIGWINSIETILGLKEKDK